MKAFFLAPYQEASFIVQQKAYMLMWINIFIIPVMACLLIVNIFRNDPQELTYMITLDAIAIALMCAGLLLIHHGAYEKVARLECYCIIILLIAGYFIKHHVVLVTGYNPFLTWMFASIAFTAMFGSRFVLMITGLLYFLVNIAGYLIVKNAISSELHFYLLSTTLIGGAALIITSIASYFISFITDKSLLITQVELQKNVLLNQTLEEQVEKRTAELKESINQIKVLGGLIPICSSCKKIRDDKGYWQQLELYLRQHSEAEFTHGICPDCAAKLYPEIYAAMKKNNNP